MSTRPPLASASPMPFFVRTVYHYDPPATASLEHQLAFGRGELGLIHHVEPSGWAECSLLNCGSGGWIPLNYCNVFDPKPMRPLLKAVIKLTAALRLGTEVPVVSDIEGDIEAIVHGISHIMNLGFRLDADSPQIGAWKILQPLIICVHNLILILLKRLGTLRDRTPSQGQKDSIHRNDLVSVAFEIVIKADNFLSTVQELKKSNADRSLTNTKVPSALDNKSNSSQNTIAEDASTKEPDSPLKKGPNKHTNTVHFSATSLQRFPERKSSFQAQKQGGDHHDLPHTNSKAQPGQHSTHCTDKMQLQPLEPKTFIPDQFLIGRAPVTQCSLPALIEYLTSCEPRSIREQLVAAFFITWEQFCTPEELLNALTKRFIAAKNKEGPQGRKIQLRVCYALKVWLESHWPPDTDQRILRSLESFLRCEVHNVSPALSTFLLHLTKNVGIPQQGHTSNTPSTPIIKGNTECRHNMTMEIANRFFTCRVDHLSVVHICHTYLAAQITSMQMQVFCAIQSRELLAGRWMAHDPADAPNVVAMCRLTNGISNWVKESVLTEAEPKRRGRVIATWILVAQHLFQLSNFDGLVAVTSGLDDTSVLRLKQSWDAVSVQAKESFHSLRRIVDPSENRKTLRALFSSSPAPRVPFLGSYLSQLVFANEYHKVKNVKEGEVSSDSDEKIVNWEKYARIASIVQDLIGSQQPFDITPDIELQMWIGKKTSEFWCPDQNCLQEMYYERSKFLES
ncbi:Ras guanine-nucleotide exchange Cdc25p, partial [Fusarium phyllophilum]